MAHALPAGDLVVGLQPAFLHPRQHGVGGAPGLGAHQRALTVGGDLVAAGTVKPGCQLPAGGAPQAPRGARRRGQGGERRREPRPEDGEGAPQPRPAERASRPRGGGEGGAPQPRPEDGEA